MFLIDIIKRMFKKENQDDCILLKNQIKLLEKNLNNKDNELKEKDDLITQMKQEYQILKSQNAITILQAKGDLKIEMYRTISQLLVNYPTAKEKIKENPNLKAKDMFGMLKPLEKMVESLVLEQIGNLNEVVRFNSRLHSPVLPNKEFSEGTEVTVKFIGYKMGEVILDKAKVS